MLRSMMGLFLMFWTALAHAAPCAGFIDVDDSVGPTAPFCADVAWLKNRGITLGCTATTYCPFTDVNRLQMAAFMHRLGNVTFQQGGNAFAATAVLGTIDNQPLEIIVNNSGVMRYEPNAIGPNVIGGHPENNVTAGNLGATIGGGGGASISNSVSNNYGTVAGGRSNTAGYSGSVGGGDGNHAAGIGSTVPGGVGNYAGGFTSVAMGHRAVVIDGAYGSFVFADATNANFTSFAPNEFVVRASGGIGFYTSGNASTYCTLSSFSGSWSCVSSRDVKNDFAPVDPGGVLDKVVDLPISSWRFKGEPAEVRHIGPFAQDFRASFGLGTDDQTIFTVDIQGVALAGIQGLNAKLEAIVAEQAKENARLRAELAELRSLKEEVASIRAAQSRESVAGR